MDTYAHDRIDRMLKEHAEARLRDIERIATLTAEMRHHVTYEDIRVKTLEAKVKDLTDDLVALERRIEELEAGL